MKNALFLAAGLVGVIGFVSPVNAETYQWKDASGRTVISDTPPPGYVLKKGPGASTSPPATPPAATAPGNTGANNAAAPKAAPAPSAPKTAAEQDMEFKKRQLAAKEKAEKDAREQQQAAEKRENCERAQRAVATLEKAPLVGTYNDKGQQVMMSQNERQQELERARQAATAHCQ